MQTVADSYVYFLFMNPGYVKIGVSKNPKTRMRSIIYGPCTSEPNDLWYGQAIMLGVLPGGRELEAAMHAKFYPYRLMGEWFVAVDEILSFVADNTQPVNSVEEGWDETTSRSLLATVRITGSGNSLSIKIPPKMVQSLGLSSMNDVELTATVPDAENPATITIKRIGPYALRAAPTDYDWRELRFKSPAELCIIAAAWRTLDRINPYEYTISTRKIYTKSTNDPIRFAVPGSLWCAPEEK